MPAVKIGIEVKGAKALTRAMTTLGEVDAPFLREALDDSGQILETAIRSRGKGRIGASTRAQGVKGSGGALRAVVTVDHPGAKSMEFGRKNYYRGYTNRRQKSTGQKFRSSRGQPARPFVGVKGGQAVGASEEPIKKKITDAIEKEWDRITSQGD